MIVRTTVSIVSRLKSAFDSLGTQWSSDPAARGAAKMVTGAALIAEGIFGFARGSRGATSLVNGAILGVGALVFIAVGSFVAPDSYPDGVQVTGYVSGINEGRDSDGNHSYKAVYEFEVQDKTYSFTSSLSGSKRPMLGSPVRIVYSASQPRNAYREDGIDGWFSWLFIGPGIFMALWAAISIVISVTLIVLGARLFFSGRKDRARSGHSAGLFQDLFSFVTAARKS